MATDDGLTEAERHYVATYDHLAGAVKHLSLLLADEQGSKLFASPEYDDLVDVLPVLVRHREWFRARAEAMRPLAD